MKLILFIMVALIALPFVIPPIAQRLRRFGKTLAANIAEGSHINSDTHFAEEAIATKFLLVKKGSASLGILINGANTRPVGVCTDSPASGEEADVTFFGARNETVKMVASEAIAEDKDVYTAANGKIQDEPAVAGTYYRVGRSLRAAGADGDVVEVDPCVPVKVVVVAALTATTDIDALNSTAVNPTKADFDALLVATEKVRQDLLAIAGALATPAEIKVLA